MANLPAANDLIGNAVTEAQFKANFKLLIENIFSKDQGEALSQGVASLRQYIDSLVINANEGVLSSLLDDLLADLATAGAGQNGWIAELVSYNGISQEKINDGLASIYEMIGIPNPKNGMRVFVKGGQGGWFEYNASKALINDEIIIFNGWVRITLETVIRPEWAGAVAYEEDPNFDSTFAIQKCLNYCSSTEWLGSVNNINKSTFGGKLVQFRDVGYRITSGLLVGKKSGMFSTSALLNLNATQESAGFRLIADFDNPLQWAVSSSNWKQDGTRPTLAEVFKGSDYDEGKVSLASDIVLDRINIVAATGKRIYGGLRLICGFNAKVNAASIGFEYGIYMNACFGDTKISGVTQHYKCGLLLRNDNNGVNFSGYYNAFRNTTPMSVADGYPNLCDFVSKTDFGLAKNYEVESVQFGVLARFGSTLSFTTCVAEDNDVGLAAISTSISGLALYTERNRLCGLVNGASKLDISEHSGAGDNSYWDVGINARNSIGIVSKSGVPPERPILNISQWNSELVIPMTVNDYVRGVKYKHDTEKTIYVGIISGDDRNSGRIDSAPVKTLDAAFERIKYNRLYSSKASDVLKDTGKWTIVFTESGTYETNVAQHIYNDIRFIPLNTSVSAKVSPLTIQWLLYGADIVFDGIGVNVIQTSNPTYSNAPFWSRSGRNSVTFRSSEVNLAKTSLVYLDGRDSSELTLILSNANIVGNAECRLLQSNQKNFAHIVNVVKAGGSISADITSRADKGIAVPVEWQSKVIGI